MKKLFTLLLVALMMHYTFATEGETPGDIKKVVLSGKIQDEKTGEDLIGVTIYIKEIKTGTITNISGDYMLNLKPGKYNLVISYIGYETIEKPIDIKENTKMNFSLKTSTVTLNEVVIESKIETENTTSTEMSAFKLKPEQIKAIPALLGEVDVIKVIQLLPGVQSSGEGLSGFNVRGGGSEQNLILLDGATVYNASHLMGFFSVFNNDAISNAKLYKGDIPASEGGRLSSLLDIKSKESSSNKIQGNAGIGTISSRLALEGPVLKDKIFYNVSGRRSYADMFLRMAKDTNIRKNNLYFYDFNGSLVYKMNPYNKFYFSAYNGKDLYAFDKAFGMTWGNTTFSVRWNHIWGKKMVSNFSLIRTKYLYNMSLSDDIAGFTWKSDIIDYGVKSEFDYFFNDKNIIRFGANTTIHKFNPGQVEASENSSFKDYKMPENKALEHAFYISHEIKTGKQLSMDYGVRIPVFQNIGKGTIYNYDNSYQAIDSIVYRLGEIFNTYSGIEPRISVKYLLDENSSIKAGYSRNMQFIHLASNSQGGTPFDLWFPSNPNIKPQTANQYALGYYRNLRNNTIETSVEIYYKDMANQIDFKDHAMLMLNEKLEGELRFGAARAYGAEFLVRKQSGKLTGWVSYTLSKSERKIDEINKGKWYNSNYDKTHNISLVGSYQLSERLSLSACWVYITGAPVTFPTGRFEFGGSIIPIYSERNGYRMPDYHRLDLSMTLKGKEKPGKKINGEWNFSLYNTYYRKNAFSLNFDQDPDNPNTTIVNKVYLFPIIPSITYNIKF